MTEPTDDLEWTITLHIPTAAGQKVLEELWLHICGTVTHLEERDGTQDWEIHVVTDGPKPAEVFDPEQVES